MFDNSPDFRSRVEAACCPADELLDCSDLRAGLAGSDWLARLFRGDCRTPKQLRSYDRHRANDNEDRGDPTWLHRVSLTYTSDAALELDAPFWLPASLPLITRTKGCTVTSRA